MRWAELNWTEHLRHKYTWQGAEHGNNARSHASDQLNLHYQLPHSVVLFTTAQRRVEVASCNVMAHGQKPDFVFRRNGRVHLNRRRRQFSRLLVAGMCASAFIVGSNAGYTMFRGSVKSTAYPLHSPVSPSLPVTVCHHVSTAVQRKLACFSHVAKHLHFGSLSQSIGIKSFTLKRPCFSPCSPPQCSCTCDTLGITRL
jgi:hypothetical protein